MRIKKVFLCLFKWTTYVKLNFSPDSLQTASSYTKSQPDTQNLLYLVSDCVVCPAARDEICWSSPAHPLLYLDSFLKLVPERPVLLPGVAKVVDTWDCLPGSRESRSWCVTQKMQQVFPSTPIRAWKCLLCCFALFCVLPSHLCKQCFTSQISFSE